VTCSEEPRGVVWKRAGGMPEGSRIVRTAPIMIALPVTRDYAIKGNSFEQAAP